MTTQLHDIEVCDDGDATADDEDRRRDDEDRKSRRWRDRRDIIRTVGSVIVTLAAAYGAVHGR